MNLCGFDVGLDRPLFLIAGPDTLESEQLCLDVAGAHRDPVEAGVADAGEERDLAELVGHPAFLSRTPPAGRYSAKVPTPADARLPLYGECRERGDLRD